MLGLIYVLQFKEIKKKQLGYFYTRLPSLQILDAMNSRAVAVGWLFLTIGRRRRHGLGGAGAASTSPATRISTAMSLRDPKIFISVVTWVVYSFAVLARRMMGWTGRRAAWLSASGFAIVLLNFIAVSYFFPQPTSHDLPMNLLLLGVSHRTAPVDLREKLDFSSGDVGPPCRSSPARASVPECVVLSTCNRSEIYVANDDLERARRDVIEFLGQFHGLPSEAFTEHLFTLEGRGGGRDICSAWPPASIRRVVGEPQILGQVKEAFQKAVRAALHRSAAAAACSTARSSSASACAPRRRSAKARSRSASKPSRSRARFSTGSRAGACWSSAPATSAR